MSGFFNAPQFLPIEPPLPNGVDGDVLTIVGGQRAWASDAPGSVQTELPNLLSVAPAAGVYNNYQPVGFVGGQIQRLDINTAAGNVELTGLAGRVGYDGFLCLVSNTGPNLLTLDPLNNASANQNQFRIPGQMILPQYDSILLCYYSTAGTYFWAKAA